MMKLKRGKTSDGEYFLYDPEDGQVVCYCQTSTMCKLIRLGLRLLNGFDNVDEAREAAVSLRESENAKLRITYGN